MFAAVSQSEQLTANKRARCTLSGMDVSFSAGTVIGRFEPITLGEMAGVALLNRTDTKNVMSSDTRLGRAADLIQQILSGTQCPKSAAKAEQVQKTSPAAV